MFITTSSDDLWRNVPPEEKLELMALAQSRATLTCMVSLIVAATISVALQMTWIFWAGIICSPFFYQFTAGKSWRSLRPRVMLEYLAARAAARRYAYVVKSEKLDLNFLFRGDVEHLFEDEDMLDEMEASIQDTKRAAAWIALFGDAIVMMSEKNGGAKLEFGALMNDRLKVIPGSDDSDGYSTRRELYLEYEDRHHGMSRVKLTSRYPAAMVVFEKRVQQMHEALLLGASANEGEELEGELQEADI